MLALRRHRHKCRLAPVAESAGVPPSCEGSPNATWRVRPLANAQPMNHQNMNDQQLRYDCSKVCFYIGPPLPGRESAFHWDLLHLPLNAPCPAAKMLGTGPRHPGSGCRVGQFSRWPLPALGHHSRAPLGTPASAASSSCMSRQPDPATGLRVDSSAA
jgi:hypothetical protein